MNFYTRIVVVASVVAASLLSCTEAVAFCKEGDTAPCYTCTHLGTCGAVGDPVSPGPRCTNDQVCINNNGVGTCGPAAGSPCACEPYTLGCDAYDPFAVTACVSQDLPPENFEPQIVQMCPIDQPCSGGRCVAPGTKPVTCTEDNVNTRYPHEKECDKYYTCSKLWFGTYRYVESTCFFGTLFNSEKGFCDLSFKVSNCP